MKNKWLYPILTAAGAKTDVYVHISNFWYFLILYEYEYVVYLFLDLELPILVFEYEYYV